MYKAISSGVGRYDFLLFLRSVFCFVLRRIFLLFFFLLASSVNSIIAHEISTKSERSNDYLPVLEEELPPPQGAEIFPMPADEFMPLEDMDLPAQPFEKNPPVKEKIPSRLENSVAEFSGLYKITGHITNFDVYVGETFQFGTLQISPKVCYSRPSSEKPRTDVFVQIDKVTFNKELKRVFTGWLFAETSGVSSLEDPVYDVWLERCKNKSSVPSPGVPIVDLPAVQIFFSKNDKEAKDNP